MKHLFLLFILTAQLHLLAQETCRHYDKYIKIGDDERKKRHIR